jgi:hypothetical protein
MSEQVTQQFPAAPGPPPRDHGHTWRLAAIAALTALIILLPLAAYLVLRGDSRSSQPSGSAAPSSPAAPSVATPSPSSPEPSASRAPDGRISLKTLGNAALTIPAWPTDNVRGPSGRLQFHNGTVRIRNGGRLETGKPPTGSEIVLLDVTYGDVDRDGAAETVAEFGCVIQGGSKQLVAFDRDTAGHIVTIGQIVATTGEIRDIATGNTRVGNDGVITARVGDFQRCCDDQTPQVWQNRGYQRRDGKFEQVGGPARMSANPYVTETSATAGELVLGPATGGYRYGTLTVTVTNSWGARPAHFLLTFDLSGGLEPTGTAWPPVTGAPGGSSIDVRLAPPPAGGSARYTFAFRRPAGTTGGRLVLGSGGANSKNTQIGEANPWNNGTVVPIRTAD